MMTVQDWLAGALCSEDPERTLADAVRGLVAQGMERDAVYEELERLRGTLRETGREAEDDLVLDVMDLLTGWCSPQARI
jgi:hypothetical protein